MGLSRMDGQNVGKKERERARGTVEMEHGRPGVEEISGDRHTDI